jgi:hypothetical protein
LEVAQEISTPAQSTMIDFATSAFSEKGFDEVLGTAAEARSHATGGFAQVC